MIWQGRTPPIPTPSYAQDATRPRTSCVCALRSGVGRAGHAPAAPKLARAASPPLAAGTCPAFRPPPCHSAQFKVSGLETWRAAGPRGFSYPSSAHHAILPVCMCSLTKTVMREHIHTGWIARRWHLLIGIRWLRLQCRISSIYYRRVTVPQQFWLACGCPEQFRRPWAPWWQPFVWRWLVVTGWVRVSRRR